MLERNASAEVSRERERCDDLCRTYPIDVGRCCDRHGATVRQGSRRRSRLADNVAPARFGRTTGTANEAGDPPTPAPAQRQLTSRKWCGAAADRIGRVRRRVRGSTDGEAACPGAGVGDPQRRAPARAPASRAGGGDAAVPTVDGHHRRTDGGRPKALQWASSPAPVCRRSIVRRRQPIPCCCQSPALRSACRRICRSHRSYCRGDHPQLFTRLS